MKNLLILTLAISILACKGETKPDYAIISGKIVNKQIGNVSINSFDRTFTENIVISEDGSFLDTLSTDISNYVLFDGRNPIFLNIEPGHNLNINYDAKDFNNTISITGIGAGANNYLIAKRKMEIEHVRTLRETYLLNEAEFKEKIITHKASQDSLLNNSKDIDNDFLNKEKRNLQYGYLNNLNEYEQAHRHLSKNQNFMVSDDFLNELEDLDYNNEADFDFSNEYKSLVNSHYANEAEVLALTQSIANDVAFLKIASSISNETIKNKLLFDFASNNMGTSKDIETFYELFNASSSNEKNNALIKEKYNKVTGLIKGKPSPKFVDYENYAGGSTSLDDLKGKYVYIDVWATWCGPCKAEIPSLKKVEAQYHNKNIEFVSISIDKDSAHDKWKAMVNDRALGGIQLFADSDWSSSFIKDYQIQGIPRFILIDPNGNIVDSNAPRPSNPSLVELFNSLNI